MVTGPTCACGRAIGCKSKTGLCRSCGMKRALADPAAHARMLERNRHTALNLSPEAQERRREHGRWLARERITAEAWARSQRPDVRAAVGRANTERTLGWCPPEKRDEYRRLRVSLRYSAAEARRIIEADIPGTVEHSRRLIANHQLKAWLRRERERAEAY